MRIAYLDPFAGISGDMFVGALIDAGAPLDRLRETVARLDLGAHLETRKTDRSGIRALKADVLVGSALAEATPVPAETTAHPHRHEHGHDHPNHHEHHDHHHAHDVARSGEAPVGHTPHRSLAAIRELILGAELPATVTDFALRTFEELGQAEAKVHGIPINEVHFHEVGAIDAIADIVLAATAVDTLDIAAWHCAPLNVGGGTVRCTHGEYPVPAPATAELLRGVPTYSSGNHGELVTPTGAAIIRALRCHFGPAPAMQVDEIGYGAGGRNPTGFPNVLRVSLGETVSRDSVSSDTVTVIETAIDDLNPQIIGYVTEKALQLGALDVICAPVQMKKNRPGLLLTVLTPPGMSGVIEDLLLRETSSLGLRVRQERRVCLARESVAVDTEWGSVRVKVGRREGAEWNAAPEYEDCRAVAERHGVALKHVMAAALQAYRKAHPL